MLQRAGIVLAVIVVGLLALYSTRSTETTRRHAVTVPCPEAPQCEPCAPQDSATCDKETARATAAEGAKAHLEQAVQECQSKREGVEVELEALITALEAKNKALTANLTDAAEAVAEAQNTAAAAAAAANAAASAATTRPAAPSDACPFTKRIGLRPVLPPSEPERRKAFAEAPSRTQGAPALCGRALDWPPMYTMSDLDAAQRCYKPNPVPRICIGAPVTSWSNNERTVRQSFEERNEMHHRWLMIYTKFFESLSDTISENESRFTLDLYLGVDEGDPYFDNEATLAALRQRFGALAEKKKIPFRIMDPMVLPLLYGNNVYFWNHVLAQAFIDGCDYIYQASDDNTLITKDIFAKFLEWIQECREPPWSQGVKYRNLGLMCPKDGKWDCCFQGFTHRSWFHSTGWFFHPTFANWSPDTWITMLFRKYLNISNLGDQGTTESLNTDEQGKRYSPCKKHELMEPLAQVTFEHFRNWVKTDTAAMHNLRC